MRAIECAFIQRGWRADDIRSADLSVVQSWAGVVFPNKSPPKQPNAATERIMSKNWKARLLSKQGK